MCYIDIHKYIRKINLKNYLLGNKINTYSRVDTTTVGVDSGLKNKFLFNPTQPSNHQVGVFKQLVLKDLEGIVPKWNTNPRYIQVGIEKLEHRSDIIIRPADKGGGVGILNKTFITPKKQACCPIIVLMYC